MTSARRVRWALLATCLVPAAPAQAQDKPAPDRIEAEFRDPPESARPRVWWHWMNGNITEEGITRDLEWMKRAGIGGLQNFDVNIATPRVVEKPLLYMTPAWKQAFRHAAATADRLGLELAIAASPGFSVTGGPWVPPADGMKKLVWSETALTGGKRFRGALAPPPSVTGPYQAMPKAPESTVNKQDSAPPPPTYYADVAVLAVRSGPAEPRAAAVLNGAGEKVDGTAVTDGNLETSIAIPPGTPDAPGTVTIDLGAPRTIRSTYLHVPVVQAIWDDRQSMRLEAEVGGRWQPVATVAIESVPTTASFAPVSASRFRVVLPPRRAFKLAEFQLFEEPRVDRAELKAGFGVVRDYYALTTDAAASDAGVAPDAVIDLTARMRPDGTLDWTPPRGNWRVLRFGTSLLGKVNHPAPPEATGLEVDKLDGAAVRRYLETYLGMYRDAAGPDLIGKRGVRALLADSTEVGALNWTPAMVAEFKRLRGYDPTPWLPAVTGTIVGTRAQSDAFLYDLRRTIADLMASEHYGTLAKVAHENGLIFYGEALEDRRPVLGDDMAMRAPADIPMAAMWVYPRNGSPKVTYLADVKGAASVANVYGRKFVAVESLTSVSPAWSDMPADLRRVIDLEYALGMNRPVIHTSVHQPLEKPPGFSLYFVGQFFNRHETWAEMAKPWMDYMARNSFLLQQGRNVADVAYFYGEEAPLTGLYASKPVADAPTRYGFDFVNADALLGELSVADGAIVSKGGARYRLLYLGGSSRKMTLPALRKLAALVEAGATLVGNAPEGSPSLPDNGEEYRALVAKLWGGQAIGKGRVIAGQDVEAGLAAIGVTPDFAYSKPQADSELLFVHRKLDDGDSYFLTNRRNRAEQVEARFRVTGKAPELWRADTGTIEPLSYRIEGNETVVPLRFDAEESFHIVFRKPAAAPSAMVAAPVFETAATLDGAWDVAFQPGRGAPASLTLPALGALSEQADLGVKYFSGIATYTRSFRLPKGSKPGAPLLLDLGAVGDIAEVRVNGQLVGTVWHAPYRLDIGKAVRRGANKIEVRVANAWFNRLVGDAQKGATKVGFTTISPPAAGSKLKPSGLIGPVTLSIATANASERRGAEAETSSVTPANAGAHLLHGTPVQRGSYPPPLSEMGPRVRGGDGQGK